MKHRFIFAIACLCGAGRLAGKEARFELLKTRITLPETPPTEAYTLKTDKNELTFIPPRGAWLSADRKKREVRFGYRDERCLIVLRCGDVSPELVSPGSWAKLRNIVVERYPGAEVSEGSACLNSCGARGCSFIIHQSTGYRNFKVMTHLSFIPIEGGTLEISMAATDEKFPAQQAAFRNFLNCLTPRTARISKAAPGQ